MVGKRVGRVNIIVDIEDGVSASGFGRPTFLAIEDTVNVRIIPDHAFD